MAPCAWAQEVTGRFFPEKDHYLVGEPIIVDLEVVNGTDSVAEIGTDHCPWLNPKQFEVANASPAKHSGLVSCTQGTAGSCLGSSVDIPAGGRYLERFLLEGLFQIDSPGVYHVHATGKRKFAGKGHWKFSQI